MQALSFLALCAIVLTSPKLQAQEPGPVVFSEIMWMGSGTSSADEWIELYNRGTKAIDLTGWTITRTGTDGAEQEMVTIGEGTIAAGGTFLIANYSGTSSRSQLATTVQFVSSAVALPNSKLQLYLYDSPKGGHLVDTADDGTGRPLGGTTEPPSAMVREVFGISGSEPEAWSTATESHGWRSGAIELGTPGALPTRLQPKGDTRATGVAGTTWAHMKAGNRN
ncbi:MAG: lamin tail domain-containing protein [Gemmatimonadetes bacterium]|jgi:hypothetical protein|nr:lamin tail domain-containing protein [Gemmatimonadota bacterium]MBT6149289.1 lamin tail domain-containing protein [Gemmatimonadota bacterium]MBT7862855.1 lamin tail domain-containing protein [Gemmatimonadota bacterium]